MRSLSLSLSLLLGTAEANTTWTMTDLGTLGGRHSGASAINRSGQVAGTSYTAAGDTHAVLWTPDSNLPPTANAGVDVSQECLGLSCTVVFDGTGSTDPDSTPGTQDDIASYGWFEDYGTSGQKSLATGASASVELTLGTHQITLLVTDRAGATDTDTVVVTLDPAALALLSFEKVEIEFGKGKAKLHGKVALPVGLLPIDVTPVATVDLRLGSYQVLTAQPVTFQVKGDALEKWEVESAGSVRKFKIDWKGASFRYGNGIELEAEHIGAGSTDLEIKAHGATGFTVTVGGSSGVSIAVDGAGQVSVTSAATVPLEVDDDGEINVDLPFALTPDMTIEIAGSVQRSILVADYYTAPVGKYKLEASLAALPASIDGTLSPATLDLKLTVGAPQFPGAVGLADWQKRSVKKWKFEGNAQGGGG